MDQDRESRSASYFDEIYARDRDPWSFETSAYEHAKYDATLAALPRPRYGRALEVGCSIGVLTRMLAGRADLLLAVDAAERPLVDARRRCADLPHVEFARMRLPEELPDGTFDLVLLSEVAYYWNVEDLGRVCGFLGRALAPGGDLVLVHWTGPHDQPLQGDEAAEALISTARPFAHVLHQERTAQYRLDVLRHA